MIHISEPAVRYNFCVTGTRVNMAIPHISSEESAVGDSDYVGYRENEPNK
jgi:hypothetical protein